MANDLLIGLTGARHAGKTTAGNMLVKRGGFTLAHPFGPGKAMCIAFAIYRGIDESTAYRMVHGDMKDTPHPLLPGGSTMRYMMEEQGKFMPEKLGLEWTLGSEIAHHHHKAQLTQQGPIKLAFESIVYEADEFKRMGGKIIRLIRAGTDPAVGLHTHAVQEAIEADFTIVNNGSKEALGAALYRALELFGYTGEWHERS